MQHKYLSHFVYFPSVSSTHFRWAHSCTPATVCHCGRYAFLHPAEFWLVKPVARTKLVLVDDLFGVLPLTQSDYFRVTHSSSAE